MKIASKFPFKLAITGAALIVVAASGTVVALNLPQKQINTPSAPVAVQRQADPVKTIEDTPAKVAEPKTETTETPATTVETPKAEEPKVLTTQEYGEKYLDLSGVNQECFDNIIATFPDRFTPDVRENNVKALRMFAAVCSTGMFTYKLHPVAPNQQTTPLLLQWGRNGEFFDSPQAKSYHD